MSRVQELDDKLNYMSGLLSDMENVAKTTIDQIAVELSAILVSMTDIARSLALLADKLTKGEEE